MKLFLISMRKVRERKRQTDKETKMELKALKEREKEPQIEDM